MLLQRIRLQPLLDLLLRGLLAQLFRIQILHVLQCLLAFGLGAVLLGGILRLAPGRLMLRLLHTQHVQLALKVFQLILQLFSVLCGVAHTMAFLGNLRGPVVILGLQLVRLRLLHAARNQRLCLCSCSLPLQNLLVSQRLLQVENLVIDFLHLRLDHGGGILVREHVIRPLAPDVTLLAHQPVPRRLYRLQPVVGFAYCCLSCALLVLRGLQARLLVTQDAALL
mmetsp:Transcript_40647/g.102879  ORF Transcript_40647/g.102879 Transcript_40647/m.102879 type:complete len:224 (+) Transcript_40647:1050-1721(+)